jgi:hypothetical protein
VINDLSREAFLVQEIESFNSCFTSFRAKQAKQKAFEESGELPVGRLSDFKFNSYRFTILKMIVA